MPRLGSVYDFPATTVGNEFAHENEPGLALVRLART